MIEKSEKNSYQFEHVPCNICKNNTQFYRLNGSRTDCYISKFNVEIDKTQWVMCKQCGLLFQSPRLTKKTILSFYTENKYFDSSRIESLIKEGLIKHNKKINYAMSHCNNKANLMSRGTAVEVGAGIGGAVNLLKQTGWTAIGVEPDPVIAAAGSKYFGINLIDTPFGSGALPQNSVAFFYSNHVFEHLDNPQEVVDAMKEMLIADGYIFTCVPTWYKNSSYGAYAWSNLCHNYMFTHKTLGYLFEKNGFVVIDYQYQSSDNELWMLVKKNSQCGNVEIQYSLDSKQYYRYYKYSTFLRACIFWPQRILALADHLRGLYKVGGARYMYKHLIVMLRAPLADIYRSGKSILRAQKIK